MNNDEFMSLLSTSVNDNHQAQAQTCQETQPMVDPSVWGYFEDTHGNYFSPDATFDPLMGVPAPTASNENETKKYGPFIPVSWALLIGKNAGGDPGSSGVDERRATKPV